MNIAPFLLLFSVLFFLSIWMGKIGNRLGVPTLLLFLAVGMIFGSSGFGVNFSNAKETEFIGTIALSIILFSGGLNTKFNDIKPVIKQSLMLSTVGVLTTALATGLFAWWLCGKMVPDENITFLLALLLASCMASTDSAAVFSILQSKKMKLKNNLAATLELESGSNDPMAYILTITFIRLIQKGGEINYLQIGGEIIFELLVGALCGYLLGKMAIKGMNKLKIDNDALYPILLLTFCLFIFSLTSLVHGNGYLAVYLGGLVIGNSKFINKRSSKNFFNGLAWFSQLLMFITLGLLVNPNELLPIAGVGLFIGLFMIFIARPLAVFASTLPFSFEKISFKDRLFISWGGLRGAVPIIFAIFPLTAGIPHARFIFNVVFFITILSLLVQGTLFGKVSEWLKLVGTSSKKHKIVDFDLELSEDMGSSIAEVILSSKALEKGDRLMDLEIPSESLVVMVNRNNDYFIPKGKTELKAGDKLLIIADNPKTIDETISRLSDV